MNSNSSKIIIIKFWVIPVFCGILFLQNGFTQLKNQNNNRIRVAQDLERRGNFESALKIYTSLFKLVPNNNLYYEGVKRNMLRLKMFNEIIEIVKSRSNNSNDPRFHADLGNVYYQSGTQDQAFAVWNSLLKNYPQNRAVYPYVANAMIYNRLYDEAIDVYKSARIIFKNDFLYVFELANIYVIRLNYKEATLEYLKYLERNPHQFNYIESRIASYTKESEQAREVAEVLKANLPLTRHEYLVRKQLADLYLRIEDYGNSLNEFITLENMTDPLDEKNQASGKEVYFFAEKALKAGEYLYAQQAFDLIISKYKDSPFKFRSIYGLALTKQKQGISGEAIEGYENLISLAPRNPWAEEALFQIGEIYFEDFFDLDNALKSYNLVLSKFPKGKKNSDTYFRIGDCFTAKGNLETALKWYEMPLNKNDSNQQSKDRALYKTAHINFLNAEFEKALEGLKKITADIHTRENVDQSYVNDALELIILIEENKKKSSEALKYFAQAQKYKLQRKHQEAINFLQEILTKYPGSNILDDSLIDIADLENKGGNYTVAIDNLQNLIKNQPKSVFNALAQKRIGEIYESGLGDFRKAYAAYELVLINYPQCLYLEEVRQKMRNLQSRQLNN